MNPHIVAFGGGVDSTAMILGLIEKNEPIDLILFADTGAERPTTYEHIENFSNYLNKLGSFFSIKPKIIAVESTPPRKQLCVGSFHHPNKSSFKKFTNGCAVRLFPHLNPCVFR